MFGVSPTERVSSQLLQTRQPSSRIDAGHLCRSNAGRGEGTADHHA